MDKNETAALARVVKGTSSGEGDLDVILGAVRKLGVKEFSFLATRSLRDLVLDGDQAEGGGDEGEGADEVVIRVVCGKCSKALKRYTTPHAGYSCNLCSRSQALGSHMHSCRGCNWDVCNSCHHRELFKLRAAAEDAALQKEEAKAAGKEVEGKEVEGKKEEKKKEGEEEDEDEDDEDDDDEDEDDEDDDEDDDDEDDDDDEEDDEDDQDKSPKEAKDEEPPAVELGDLVPVLLDKLGTCPKAGEILNLLVWHDDKLRTSPVRLALVGQGRGGKPALELMARLVCVPKLPKPELDQILAWALEDKDNDNLLWVFELLVVLEDWNPGCCCPFATAQAALLWGQLEALPLPVLALLSRTLVAAGAGELSLEHTSAVLGAMRGGASDLVCEQAFGLLLNSASTSADGGLGVVQSGFAARFH